MRDDEKYIIDLCDNILQDKAIRQHRFDFLVGDSGKKLPVDAYYRKLGLAIEFQERQHNEEVKIFDRKLTVSGVSRGEQRKIYDKRRRDILPKNGISLLEFTVYEFPHNNRKRLLRKSEEDRKIILGKLKNFIKPYHQL